MIPSVEPRLLSNSGSMSVSRRYECAKAEHSSPFHHIKNGSLERGHPFIVFFAFYINVLQDSVVPLPFHGIRVGCRNLLPVNAYDINEL